MKKGLFLVMLILALLTAGFAMAESAEDPVLATAADGALSVTLSEVKDDYDSMLAYYAYMYSMYGTTVDEYDTAFQAEVAQSVVGNTISVKAVTKWAEENGYEMTDERLADIVNAAQGELDAAREEYRSYLGAYGVQGEELDKMVDEELAASGYTLDAVIENQKLQDVIDFITTKASDGVTVTEDEVRAHFDSALEEQKKSYDESIDNYINDYISGKESLYTPEGVRIVKVIYFEPDTDEAGTSEATAAEATPAETSATVAEATPDESAKELTGASLAESVHQMIVDGTMTFDAAMAAYNQDTSSADEMQAGYPIAAGSTYYSTEFTDTAMALANIGDVSDVLVTDYGCFIFMYDHDIEAATAVFEDHVEAETTELLESKKEEAYSELLNTIVEQANIQMNDLTPLYHVYTGEAMNEYKGFALTKDAATLFDKPAGDAVANLESGVSVEILGTIEVEGTEFAFVSVLGTELKGYLATASLETADEAAAYENDNTGKTETLKVESALPIFTMIMKDGSVMYGELYPAQAPETVANFVDLANQSFYDGLIFHRVIPGFVIQGGDPNGDGTGGPSYSIKGEFTANGVENTLSHTRGVLSMARASDFDSAGSQFFIMHADGTTLDGNYAAFGLLLGGYDTLDIIASVPTDSNDKPRDDQVIRTIFVETHGETYEFNKIAD